MSKNLLVMGSPEWVEHVFCTPPVRKLKGRSSRMQPHTFFSSGTNRFVTAQGRYENCSALAIEYLVRLGYCSRAKPQPFETDKDEFGDEITPDFFLEAVLAEIARYFVIETKTTRFLTRLEQLVLESNRERLSKYGLKYLVWTDKRPLSHAVRHHLIQMRLGADKDVTRAEMDELVVWVESESAPNLYRFYKAGFDLNCLYAAAWKGAVFFPITRPLTAETRLTICPQEDLKAIFLDCTNNQADWWSQLPAC